MRYDCQTCGACCHWHESEKVTIWIVPVHKLDRVPDRLIERDRVVGHTEEYPHKMKMKKGQRCIAFRGAVGKPNSCSIYKHRPKSCREFQPGDENCLRARKAAGIGERNEPDTRAKAEGVGVECAHEANL